MSLTISDNYSVSTQKFETRPVSVPQQVVELLNNNNATDTINTSSVKANLDRLKQEGCYRAEKKFFFGTRKAQFTYYANGLESIAEIKAKFGLKDGAISKCNKNIQDDDWIPPKNYEIFFYEEDANYEEPKPNSQK